MPQRLLIAAAAIIGTMGLLMCASIVMLATHPLFGTLDVCEDSTVKILGMARRGDVGGVNGELDEGVDPDIADKNLNTPLGCAIPRDREAVVRVLLLRGADPNKVTGDPIGSYDEYPLELAMEKRFSRENDTMVGLLLDAGADPDVHTKSHSLALTQAIAMNDDELITMLLDHDADPDGIADDVPLVAAARGGKIENATLLLDHGASANGRPSQRPLAEARTTAMFDLLLARGGDLTLPFAATGPETTADRALETAAQTIDADRVQRLLAVGADPDRSPADHNALIAAVVARNTGIATVLLDAGADPALGTTSAAVFVPAVGNDPDLSAAALLGTPPSTSTPSTSTPSTSTPSGTATSGEFALALAIIGPLSFDALEASILTGYEPITQLLLDHGADPNRVGQRGVTPLAYAARSCQPGTVVALLAHGADPTGGTSSVKPRDVACPAVLAILPPG